MVCVPLWDIPTCMHLSCFGSCRYEEVHKGICGLEVGPSCEVDRIRGMGGGGGGVHLPGNAPLTLSWRTLPYKSSPVLRRNVQLCANNAECHS